MSNFRAYLPRVGLEGPLMILSPLPLILSQNHVLFSLILSVVASTTLLASSFTLWRNPKWGKPLFAISILSTYASLWNHITSNPYIALASNVVLILLLMALQDFQYKWDRQKRLGKVDHAYSRYKWSVYILPILIIIEVNFTHQYHFLTFLLYTLSILMTLFLGVQWSLQANSKLHLLLNLSGIAWALYSFSLQNNPSHHLVIVLLCLILWLLFSQKEQNESKEPWWNIFINQPARILLSTFVFLCLLGSFLLHLPMASNGSSISLLDAFFTSVSAVCVTGLIVLDTPVDFSFIGQFFILILIQLGGLGIMSITTLALYAMGKRLSLKQERLVTSATDSDSQVLMQSFKTIIKFTLTVEALGAIVLFFLFQKTEVYWYQALWKGIFTSVSAFCNAGFSLDSNSLVPFQSSPVVLSWVSLLIILGGLAPATSLIVPRWIRGKSVSVSAKIALTTTACLLFVGTIAILALEWNSSLNSLSLVDKIFNAWFQSVSLRTAGFNSIALEGITHPTFLIMNALMFIGGSPGGTAGGIKTTTLGVLALTFLARIQNQSDVIIQSRRIRSAVIYQAITIIFSGALIWFLVVLALEVTQQIPARDLVFEATSAIGTAGLSLGATSQLDSIGKLIIALAMFAGRIGPMTLFMILGHDVSVKQDIYPSEKISLT